MLTIEVSVNIAPTIPFPSANPRDISTKSVVIFAKFSLFTCNVSIIASMSAVFAERKKSPVSTVGAFCDPPEITTILLPIKPSEPNFVTASLRIYSADFSSIVNTTSTSCTLLKCIFLMIPTLTPENHTLLPTFNPATSGNEVVISIFLVNFFCWLPKIKIPAKRINTPKKTKIPTMIALLFSALLMYIIE